MGENVMLSENPNNVISQGLPYRTPRTKITVWVKKDDVGLLIDNLCTGIPTNKQSKNPGSITYTVNELLDLLPVLDYCYKGDKLGLADKRYKIAIAFLDVAKEWARRAEAVDPYDFSFKAKRYAETCVRQMDYVLNQFYHADLIYPKSLPTTPAYYDMRKSARELEDKYGIRELCPVELSSSKCNLYTVIFAIIFAPLCYFAFGKDSVLVLTAIVVPFVRLYLGGRKSRNA